MSRKLNVAEDRPVIPSEIAEAAIPAEAYGDEDAVFAAFAWLRKNMPLGVAELPGYDPIWVASKHADVMAIGRNAALFPSSRYNTILNDQANDAFLRDMTNGTYRTLHALPFLDPPEHTAHRGLTSDWFMPGMVSRLEAQIREHAKESVEHLLSFDGECDFVKDCALHYPLRVIMTLFGVPREDEPRMLKLTQEFFGTHDPEEQRSEIQGDPIAAAKQWQASLDEFFSYFNELSADRRKNPRDDLSSIVANAKIDGEYLTDFEANGYYVTIATAGHDTTSSSTAGGMHGMIQFPEQFALAKSSVGAVKGLVDESIRWASPVRHFMRSAAEDTEIRGQSIRKGDRIFLSYPSANRDEEVFDRPNEFDITRSPNRQIGFGFGPHICLGQHLAKLEMRVLFEELLPKLQSVEMANTPKMVRAIFIGGYKSLPIRFTKA